MSYDIILIKPVDTFIDDLEDIDDVMHISTQALVRDALQQVFPGCIDGVYANAQVFSVEGSLSGDPVASVHLALRFGQSWTDDSFDQLVAAHLRALCTRLQTCAFSVADNSRLAKPA